MTTKNITPKHISALLIDRYRDKIASAESSGIVDTMSGHNRLSLGNLAWMCTELEEKQESLPGDKVSRWIGFIQGCLSMRGLLSMVTEDTFIVAMQKLAHETSKDDDRLGEVNRALFLRYQSFCDQELERDALDPLSGNPHLALASVARMCQAPSDAFGDLSSDSASRGLGFVQGCLAMRGLIDVDAERNVSRPMFHGAYRASTGEVPESLQRPTAPKKPEPSKHPLAERSATDIDREMHALSAFMLQSQNATARLEAQERFDTLMRHRRDTIHTLPSVASLGKRTRRDRFRRT